VAVWALAACQTVARDAPPHDDSGTTRLSALLATGTEQYSRAEYDSADGSFSAALRQAREEGNLTAEAEALAGLGGAAYNHSHYPAARALLLEGLDLQLRHGVTTHLWRTNNLLGLVSFKEGRYYEALERHATAAALASEAGDTLSLAKSWINVAIARTELGEFHQARQLLVQALPVARASGDRRIEGRVLVNLGMLAVRTGDPSSAIRHLEEARSALADAGDVDGEMNRLGQLGTAYASMGEPGRAIAYLDTALTTARVHGAAQEAASDLEHMAAVYLEAGDYVRALRMFEDARAVNDTIGLQDEIAFDLRNIAEIHRELGNPELARRSAERALAVHRQVGNRLESLDDLLLLGRLAQEGGDRKAALAYHAEATRLAPTLSARTPRLALALATARMADLDGRSGEVLRALAPVSTDLEAVGADMLWEARWLTARAHGRRGDLDRAVHSARLAVEALERLRGQFGSGLLRTRFLSAREGAYRDLVALLLRQGRLEEAFQAADQSRGRALLDHLATFSVGGEASVRDLGEEERQLLGRIDTLTARLDEPIRTRSPMDSEGLRREREQVYAALERVRAEYATAVTRADERHRGSLALVGGTHPGNAAIRAALGPEEALLEYYLFPDRLLLFVVTKTKVTQFAEPLERTALAARIRLARELTGKPGQSGSANAVLEALHANLLGECRRSGALAGIQTLIVVPHGELEYLPFAALKDPNTGRYLVEDFTLLHLPSAAALPALQDRRDAGDRPTEGEVAVAPFPRDLPATVAETDAFHRAFPAAQTVTGRRADETKIRLVLSQAKLVHLATHGVLNARNPLFSRIELAPGRSGNSENDGRLEVHEIIRMRMSASLVFLSGCETGLGALGATSFNSGEDYATLTRALLASGASNVVATLWRVEDRGAAEFAVRFYRNLAAAPPAESSGTPDRIMARVLGEAQREMIRERVLADPFYWAGYLLTGTGKDGRAKPGRTVRS